MDYSYIVLPTTSLDWAVQIAVSLVASLIIMSFVEYVLHGYVMHQKIFSEMIYRRFPSLRTFLSDHVDLHHDTYFKQFNYEPDPHGKELNMLISYQTLAFGILLFFPFLLAAGLYISIVPPLVFIAVMFVHRLIWNTIHTEMHQPKYPAWSSWRVYRFLARYHYLHHVSHSKRTHVNYNIVIPLADYVMGRMKLVSPENEEEMKKFGYL